MDKDTIARFMDDWRRERPDIDPWPLGIIGRVPRIFSHVQRRAESWLGPLGLGWETFSVIAALRRSGRPYELNPTELQRLSLLTSGAVTNRIDRVEEMGLVERRADPSDRRGVRVRLTAQGKTLADKAIAVHFRAAAQVLGVLSEREAADLDRLLAKLLLTLESETQLPARADSVAPAGSRTKSGSGAARRANSPGRRRA